MRNWQGLFTFLISCLLLYMFWPFLVWIVLIGLAFVAFWIFRLWYLSRKAKKMWEEAEHDFDYSNQDEQSFTTHSRPSSQQDVIDVEYTERRVNDDDQ